MFIVIEYYCLLFFVCFVYCLLWYREAGNVDSPGIKGSLRGVVHRDQIRTSGSCNIPPKYRGRSRSSRPSIRELQKKLMETSSVLRQTGCGRCSIYGENLERIRESFVCCPQKSTSRRNRELSIHVHVCTRAPGFLCRGFKLGGCQAQWSSTKFWRVYLPCFGESVDLQLGPTQATENLHVMRDIRK
jgi:hypothetical protein